MFYSNFIKNTVALLSLSVLGYSQVGMAGSITPAMNGIYTLKCSSGIFNLYDPLGNNVGSLGGCPGSWSTIAKLYNLAIVIY